MMSSRFVFARLGALLAALLVVAGAPAVASPAGLLSNVTFTEDANGDGWPDGWSGAPGVTWHKHEAPELSYLRLSPVEPGKSVLLYRSLKLPTEASSLTFLIKARAADVVIGEQPWHDARVLMEFQDAAGKKTGPVPAPLIVSRGGSKDWRVFSGRLEIPAGASSLSVLAAMFNCRSGALDLGLMEFEVGEERAPVRAQADGVRAAAPAVATEPARRERWPAAVRVSGARLVDDRGREVWLQGVNVVSLEWSARGEHVREAALRAIEDWGANTLRLPVVESFWFGRDPSLRGDHADYRARVDEIVMLAANRGAYVVLDLHRFRAPREEHVEFWRDAAARYANHPAVLFDLFNEPHSISWEVWRDGGLVAEKSGASDEDVFLDAAEALRNKTAFRSPGMQALLDAVRSAGAENVVIAGGLDWAYDLSGVVAGHALAEPAGGRGRGIMYSTHIYNWKRDWQSKVLDAAARHPVFVGEIGATTKIMKFVAEDLQESPYTWVPNALGMLQKHRLHWTGFSLHPRAAPVMIEDWNYTPTPYWGEFARAALRGKVYEMTGLR